MDGVYGLLREKTRPPGIARTTDGKVAEVIRLTQEAPPHEATHWTIRAMGKAMGLAASTVRSIWKAHGHPRWTFHFIPTSSSWLNAIEGFFAKLTRRRLKHGVFHSVVDLQAAINRFIAEHNDTEAKPFIWRANPDEIIAARNRGFQMLDSIH